MDFLIPLIDSLSVLVLLFAALVAHWALRGFSDSKKALKESASYVSLIVGALSPRIQSLEMVTLQLQKQMRGQSDRNYADTTRQDLSRAVQELLANYNRLNQDLASLKLQSDPVQPTREQSAPNNLEERQARERLTQTEREILNHLAVGPLPAPEIGKLLNKSREHTARLMKKLYLDGFVDRDSTSAPFRYKVNDKLRLSMGEQIAKLRSEEP